MAVAGMVGGKAVQRANVRNVNWGPTLLFAAVVANWLWFGVFLYRNIVHRRDAYIFGDWAINYGAGFVRRGLGGELILGLSRLLPVPPNVTAFIIAAAIGTAALAMVLIIARRSVRPADVAILFSPAALGLLMGSSDAGRKDAIVFALTVLSPLLALAMRARTERAATLGALLVGLVGIATFVHEALIFYLLAIALPVAWELWRQGRTALMIAFVLGIGLAAGVPVLAIVAAGPLDARGVATVCARLGDFVPQGCGTGDDAIGWLQNGSTYATQAMAEVFRTGVYPWIFISGLVFGLTYLGLLAVQFEPIPGAQRLPRVLTLPLLHIAAFGLLSLPLYWLVSDWGRWFAMFAVQSTVYLLAMERLDFFERRKDWTLQLSGLAAAAVLAGLSLFWTLPICCAAGRPIVALW